MKQYRKKAVAAALVLTMGLSTVPAPAFAVSSNIVAETENVNTLTVSQIQDLAAIYNNTSQRLQLSLKQLELSEMQLRNKRSSTENSIQELYDKQSALSSSESVSKIYSQAAEDRAKELYISSQGQVDPTKDSQVVAWGTQAYLAGLNDTANMIQLDAGIESAYDGLVAIDKNLKTMAEGKDDLDKAMKDLESQMRYSAAYLALQIVQLDKQLEVLDDQLALMEKAVQIGELQKKLGMSTGVNVESTRANLKNAQNGKESLKVAKASLTRSLNTLIGRSPDHELNVVPMAPSGAIENAPDLTSELRKKLVDNNYTLKTLERDKEHLVEDGKDSDLGSDEKQQIDYEIASKNNEISDQKDAIIENLRTMLNNIDNSAEAYRLSNYQLTTAKKNAEYNSKRYELGMISQLDKLNSDISLKNAELTNLQNAYTYYLAWQKYNYACNGVDVSKLQ